MLGQQFSAFYHGQDLGYIYFSGFAVFLKVKNDPNHCTSESVIWYTYNVRGQKFFKETSNNLYPIFIALGWGHNGKNPNSK